MKKYISFAIALTMLASALTLGACGKKHTIDTDIAVDGHESVSGGAGVIYQAVTDKNGEAVTDAEGETVTVAVTVPAEETTTAASGEKTSSGAETSTKKGETTTAKTETTKKTETTTKNGETTTRKNETTTKKTETTTKKQETTTKKPENTTATPVPTAAPKVTIKDGEYVVSLSADKTTVKPGDTITVTLNLKNCKNVKSFGFLVRAQGSLTAATSKKNLSAEDMSMEINTSAEEGTLIGGYFKDNYSFDNYDLCTITYNVSKDAVKGETLVLSATPDSMKVGTGNGAGTDYSSAMNENVFLYVTVTD